jgi:hypothetical protein
MSIILAFRPRQGQASHTDSRCELCPFTWWNFPRAHQAERVRQLARAGLCPQAIALITGWGLLRIARELSREQT